mmetsp:Transcript_7581/g.14615  ORF Transcript_7581/g.14615 Transcript_7581/m.14615 type:complete len:162 (-) Transcript_7581:42-527(-)
MLHGRGIDLLSPTSADGSLLVRLIGEDLRFIDAVTRNVLHVEPVPKTLTGGAGASVASLAFASDAYKLRMCLKSGAERTFDLVSRAWTTPPAEGKQTTGGGLVVDAEKKKSNRNPGHKIDKAKCTTPEDIKALQDELSKARATIAALKERVATLESVANRA